MSEVDKNFGKNIQRDSQYFGNMLINKIICLLKKDINVDDNNNDELEEEEITIFNVEKQKNKRFKEYINKYYNQKNETFLEKMFQFHESTIKIKTKDLQIGKIEKIDFETFLNIQVVFPENHYNYHNNYYHLLVLLLVVAFL
jgi:hypothetical protein